MALYQPVTQHPQVMPQLQYAMYIDNQGNVNWNFIQYQQLLHAQQLHQNLTPLIPVTILAIPQQPNHSTNIIQHGQDIYNRSIDSMSPSTISTLLNAPEFIPTPKSCDNGKFKALNANCDAFLPGVTSWRKSTCTQLSAIKEDEYYEQE
eukprot:UN02105